MKSSKKIIVFEDHFQDVINIYGGLIFNYTIKVYYFMPKSLSERASCAAYDAALEYMTDANFSYNKISRWDASTNIEEADIYFCDSLDGRVYKILEIPNINKDRFFVVTNNKALENELKRRKIKTLEKTAESVRRAVENLRQ